MIGFEFATATRITFGAGAVREIGRLANAFGLRALVVSGRDLTRAEPICALLRAAGIETTNFSVAGEPELSTVEQGVALARQARSDLVIGFGGGSALDAGKAIAAVLTNEGELLEYLEVIGKGKALSRPSAPFIAVPTTAGTGAEVTRNAVLASPQHQVKVSLRSSFLLPKLAVVDPELTYDLPPPLTASTGLDALTQLIEPYVSSRANPMTDAVCVEGLRRVARSLRDAYHKGSKATSAREDMSVASLFGGLALANAGLGVVHGFAGPIGGMFPAPHGAVCAALLPHVMAANLAALRARGGSTTAVNRFQEVARLLTDRQTATAEDGIKWVRSLVADLKILPLQTYGVRRAHTAELVEKAGKASSTKANPIPLTPEELAGILERAL